MRAPSLPSFSAQDLAVIEPLRQGTAASRVELAAVTGLSPSTVLSRVDRLLERGVLVESGVGASSGGRRPRRLAVRGDAGHLVAIDLRVDRAVVGVVDLAGAVQDHVALDVDLADSPALVLRRLVESAPAGRGPLVGGAVAVPGPVSASTGRLVSPSRMPGWHGVDPAALAAGVLGAPAVAGNDANVLALGDAADAPHRIFVKADAGIGAGVVAGGRLHVGADGMAGDISHVSVPGGDPVPCTCGRTGCLDVLASGSAIVRSMSDAGRGAADVEAVIDLARDGDPLATALLRDAGAMTGGALATVVNFFNPGRLVLGGALGASEVFGAGVRSALWAECLPMTTEHLEVTTAREPETGGLVGAGRLFLDTLFALPAARGALRMPA